MGYQQNLQWSICADGWRSVGALLSGITLCGLPNAIKNKWPVPYKDKEHTND